MPIQQIMPDGKVRIYNKKTGQTADVMPDQLGSYNPRLIGEYQNIITNRKGVESGMLDVNQVPESTRTQVVGALQSSGYKPKTQFEIDEEKSKVKAKPDAEAVYRGIEKLKGQAKDTTFADTIFNKVSGGNFGINAATFDTSKKLLSQTIANLFEKGRLSDKDRDFYMNEIVNINPVGRSEAINRKLDNLAIDILNKAGYKPEDFGGKKKEDNIVVTPQNQVGSSFDPGVSNAVSRATDFVFNASKNISQDVAAGVNANQTENVRKKNIDEAMSVARNLEDQARQTQDMEERKKLLQQANQIHTAISDESKKVSDTFSEDVTDNPFLRGLKSGTEIASAAEVIANPIGFVKGVYNMGKGAVNAVTHPLQTAETVKNIANMPVSEVVQGAKDFIKADYAASGYKGTGLSLPGKKQIGEGLKNVAEKGSELITGGGPKEFIAQNVNLDEAQSLSKELQQRNILSHPTAKGKIEATQKALTDVGNGLQKVFQNSKEVDRGGEIGAELEKHLVAKYGDDAVVKEAINSIKNKISLQGKYDLASNESMLSMDDLWSLSKNAGNFKAKAFNLPNNGPFLKDVATETERFLRNRLYAKVPEATPNLRSYHALRTYMDDVLSDPEGLNIGSINKVVQHLKNVGTTATQKMYNVGESLAPTVVKKTTEESTPAVVKFAGGQPIFNPPSGNTTPLADAPKTEYKPVSLKRDMRYKQGNVKFKGGKDVFSKSIEGIQEKAEGWKIPGMRKQFDTALFNKDAETVKALLPNVPKKYLELFKDDIKKLLPS